jgi:hypothetical protein
MLLTQDAWEGGTGQVGLPDDGFITWLQGQGHTVVKKAVTAVVNAATLQTEAQSQGVQLIIIGPRNTSSNYTDRGLNAIPIPMLALLPHAIRPDRLDWVTGGAGADNTPWTTEIIVRPTHPWVAGLGNVWFEYPTGTGDTRWTTTVETDAVNHKIGNGDAIALRDGTVAPTNGTNPVQLAVWQKGVSFYGGGSNQVAGEVRAWFGGTNWARFNAGYQCSFDNYTPDGKEALRRTINGIIPEPATLALLGIGLGGLLLRRRSR